MDEEDEIIENPVEDSDEITFETVLAGRDLQEIFNLWDLTNSKPGHDPTPIIIRLAELFEDETDIYQQKNPDPFDERHPSRTDPDCEFGKMLKLLFRKDYFMTRLVNDYLRDNYFTRQNIQKSSFDLNVATCRLILLIMPGLETSAVFQTEYDTLLNRLYSWAENSPEPLQSYATGLLAAAMEVQDIAFNFREQNIKFVPLMLQRLHMLRSSKADLYSSLLQFNNPSKKHDNIKENNVNDTSNIEISDTDYENALNNSPSTSKSLNPEWPKVVLERIKEPFIPETEENLNIMETNNSIETEVIENSEQINGLVKSNEDTRKSADQTVVVDRNIVRVHPPTLATSQVLILRYLTPMGEYQEFISHVFESRALYLIFSLIENLQGKDTGLAFEALKYLASLLCHKKFSLDFINNGGLERLLQVPRPSVAATGVSISLYYLAYCEEAMEKICTLSQKLVSEIVSYALWLLGCTHDSGRCHATMFFGLAFQFKVILDEFDKQDGLRKLYNVISVLPILSSGDDYSLLNDDQQCAERQIVRHVCVSLKKYMESHLYYKYTQITRQQSPMSTVQQAAFKAIKCGPDVISEQVRTLQELLPMRAHWAPVDEIVRLGGITLLLRIIASSYEWNFNGRPPASSAETVRSALDVLTICCISPKVQYVFCERIDLPDENAAAGINVVLCAAEGEIVADSEVQKSALAVLVHCVCAPVQRPGGSVGRFGSAKKKTSNKSSEELIQKVWENVRSNNGIIILLQLMQIKTPITDADCIRGMACRALAGLARSETVRQIISKLPLFANGQLQSLIRDPILQEKRSEHVQFQKYALELMERVSGKSKRTNNELDTSLANIHRANVVAQTKIQFNEQQLFHLIHQHLIERGMVDTAITLQREANLTTPTQLQQKIILHHSPFSYKSPIPSLITRSRVRTKQSEQQQSNQESSTIATTSSSGIYNLSQTATCAINLNGRLDALCNENYNLNESETITVNSTSIIPTPIKLIKKSSITNTPINKLQEQQQLQQQQQQRSLQKQISASDNKLPTTGQRNVQQATIDNKANHNIINTTLHTIITEYLTNQHALCKNPMSTCPQFDLFVPHKCPDPRQSKVSGLCLNFADRFYRRHAGFNSKRLDRRLVHSQFCCVKILRPQDNDLFFTCCDFGSSDSTITVGAYNGEVKIYNTTTSTEEYSFHCHESYVNNISCSRDGTLVLTSCAWRPPLSALWSIQNRQFSLKYSLNDEEYCEFSNLHQDKILGTKGEQATIYDINTGQPISTLVPTIYNQYSKNRATFCPSDELILSDGVLWDVKSGRQIHKFDKLNQTLSGVFHPNGLEVVSNTEVWDLRTFHLLRTVPALEQCEIKFSPQNVLYGISPELESRIDFDGYNYESSFKTLDSYDYSSITTIDVKRNIYDLSVNMFGSQIAIVENQGGFDSVQESIVRIYAVGRKRNTEDDAEDEEEEEIDGSDDELSSAGDTIEFRNIGRRIRRRNRNGEEDWMPANQNGGAAGENIRRRRRRRRNQGEADVDRAGLQHNLVDIIFGLGAAGAVAGGLGGGGGGDGGVGGANGGNDGDGHNGSSSSSSDIELEISSDDSWTSASSDTELLSMRHFFDDDDMDDDDDDDDDD